MKKGVIFDFDGTLVDTETLIYEAVRQFLQEEYECDYSKEAYKLSVGQSEDAFFYNLKQIVGKDVDQKRLNQHIRDQQFSGYKNLKLRSGIAAILAHAEKNDYQLGIVSNSTREELMFFFDYHPITKNRFSSLITIENLTIGKPDPEGYLKCLQELGLTAGEAWVIEDSQVGAEAAVAAGISTIIYQNEFTDKMTFPRPGKIVESAGQLLSLIKEQ